MTRRERIRALIEAKKSAILTEHEKQTSALAAKGRGELPAWQYDNLKRDSDATIARLQAEIADLERELADLDAASDIGNVADNDKKRRSWRVPASLILLLFVICTATVFALLSESQRGDLIGTLGVVAASATTTVTIATPFATGDAAALTLAARTSIPLTASPLPPCPDGTGPNGIRAGNYDPYRLTDEERQWMWEAWGFEGEPDDTWGGLPCGTDYGSPDLNFFAMVCERGNVGPDGYVPGGYDPQSLSQPVRQFLWDEFREGGGEGGEIAPVGYGGQHCPGIS